MKSLQESLFDKDLMGKSSIVPVGAVWDMVFKEVYCPLHTKCVNAGWLLDLNNDGLKVYKTFNGTDDPEKKVLVRLQFDNGLSGYPCCPQLVFNHQYGAWDTNFSDGNGTRRWVTKRDLKHFNFTKGQFEDSKYFDLHFECTTETVGPIVKLMKGMIEQIISKKYTNLIQEQFDKHIARNKHVPGIIIDQVIMKPLIKDA